MVRRGTFSGRSVARRSGAAGIPGPHPHCVARLRDADSRRGFFVCGPLVRSGSKWGFESRPAPAGGAVSRSESPSGSGSRKRSRGGDAEPPKTNGRTRPPISDAPHLFQGGSTPPPGAALTRTPPPAPKPPTHTTRTAAQRRGRLDVSDVGSRQGARTRAFLGGGAGGAGARGAEGAEGPP